MIANQKTIANKTTFSGIGLHSGIPSEIILEPAEVNSGINFHLNNKVIKASWKNGHISQLCTKIKKDNFSLSTIEHLMSALCGLEIDNLNIKSNTNEMPILDGSSKEYVEKILDVGLINQNQLKKFIKIKNIITLKEDNKFIKIEPYNKNQLIIDYTIDYKDDFIKKQNFLYKHSPTNYSEIYKARTFCLHKDLEHIFSMGLAKGGSLDNAIVVSGKKILNQGGLRYNNEFVRHKILDCIGDLYLAECLILGKVTVYGGGHELNLKLLNKIFKDKKNFDILN